LKEAVETAGDNFSLLVSLRKNRTLQTFGVLMESNEERSFSFSRLEGDDESEEAESVARFSEVDFLHRHGLVHSNSVYFSREGMVEHLKSAFSWKWLGPVVVICLTVVSFAIGVGFYVQTLDLSNAWVKISLGLALVVPCVYLVFAFYFAQPSARTLQNDSFYSDALLEEMLTGENILDLYTVTTSGRPPRDGNVVVFLSGVGGLSETWKNQVEAVVDAGFPAIQIQLPGSGCLNAVTFSIERAALVVMRVLEEEVFDEPLVSGSESSVSFDFSTPRNLNKASSPSFSDADSRSNKVVVVAWGLACHVAMYLASSKRLGNDHLAGLTMLGTPYIPRKPGLFLRLRYNSMWVSWIAQMARLSEYALVGADVRREIRMTSLRPKARAEWGTSFYYRYEGLRNSCNELLAPILCMTHDAGYLAEFRRLFGGQLDDPGSNVEGVLNDRVRAAHFQSFPHLSDGDLYATNIVDFVSFCFT